RGTRREQEAQSPIEEYPFDAGGELEPVHRKVEASLVLTVQRRDAAAREHRVDAEMAGIVPHVVGPAVAGVSQDLGQDVSGHGDLAHADVEEGGDGWEERLPAVG